MLAVIGPVVLSPGPDEHIAGLIHPGPALFDVEPEPGVLGGAISECHAKFHPAAGDDVKDGDVLVTDGPFAEGKEHIGGFWVIKAPDLDEALEWGRRATRACATPIEVRPFQDESED